MLVLPTSIGAVPETADPRETAACGVEHGSTSHALLSSGNGMLGFLCEVNSVNWREISLIHER